MKVFLIQLLRHKCQYRSQDAGFTLVLALSTGLVMMVIVATLIFRASQHQNMALARTETGDSTSVAEAGVARILAQFTKPENAVLLNRDYDPINPSTGKSYLGIDGVPNTNDEISSAVDEWTGFSPPTSPCPNALPTVGASTLSKSGTIDTNGQYQLLAYRYNRSSQTGTFLVEGKRVVSGQMQPAISYIGVKVSILNNFPGVISSEDSNYVEYDTLNVAGRSTLGKNGNVYFDPSHHYVSPSPYASLEGSAALGESNRPSYHSLIDSVDTDNISGKLFACWLDFTPLSDSPPAGVTPISLGILNDSNNTSITSATGGIAYYQTDEINLNTKTVDIDTTNNPVYLYVKGPFVMSGTSQIRNIRTDGKPPRVGDLRIIVSTTQLSPQEIEIYGYACIQTAFLYNRTSDLKIRSLGDGCPSSGNSNIDGVVWAEDIDNQTGSDAGITVPDDVSTLSDLTTSVGLPIINKLGSIQNWQRYKL